MTASDHPAPLSALPARALKGILQVPGDKSISHRAVMLGGLAHGMTMVQGLLESDDVMASAAAMRAMGAVMERDHQGRWRIHGTGNGALLDPEGPLDLGNAGTGVRLLMGLCAGQGVTATFTGDASLSKRPMGRVIAPLARMGAQISASPGDRLPLTLKGSAPAIAIDYVLPVPSAQVKSAVLLAGLNAIGVTSVLETEHTRDHTERMLRHFGAELDIRDEAAGRRISLKGEAQLEGRDIIVPGDPSSAAFPLVAALLVPGSDVRIENVMINPTRAGLFETLRDMGGDIVLENQREAGGEPVADIRVRASALRAVEVPAARAPSMIDEYPVLAVAAAAASGTTIMRGLGELRVKESDRLASVLEGLAANGVAAHAEGDDLIVQGTNGAIPGGGMVATHLDHRIAMSFLVMGLAARTAVSVDDTAMIATSFPRFLDIMRALGAGFADAGGNVALEAGA